MKKYIIAWNRSQATHYAKYIANLNRSEWEFIGEPRHLRGLRDAEIIIVGAPRYTSTIIEDRIRGEMAKIIVTLVTLSGCKVTRVNLP